MKIGKTHKVVWETFGGSVHGASHTGMPTGTSDKATYDEEQEAHPA
jgi:hypothetical protein